MKKIITSPNAPAPIGPYSQAVMAGNTLYISGQIALDPSTGELRTQDIKSETILVMKNLGAVLEAAGMNYANLVKCGIFLSSMDFFGEMNEVYAQYFGEDAPARETVAVKGLPKGVNVEISGIAIKLD